MRVKKYKMKKLSNGKFTIFKKVSNNLFNRFFKERWLRCDNTMPGYEVGVACEFEKKEAEDFILEDSGEISLKNVDIIYE